MKEIYKEFMNLVNSRPREGDQEALICLNTDTGEKRKFTYREFAAEGNKIVRSRERISES